MPLEVKRDAPLSRHVAAVAEARFRANSDTALRGISAKAETGVLVREGRRSTFFRKQLTQEIEAKVEGASRS